MKFILRKSILSLLAVFICINTNAQDTLKFKDYKKFTDYVTSAYAHKYHDLEFFKYKLVGSPINIYDAHKGEISDTILTTISYLSLINDLDISNFKHHAKINMDYTMQRMIDGVNKNYVPLSITFVEYSDFKDTAWASQMVSWYKGQFIDNAPHDFYPFRKKYLFASAPLNQAFETNTINFFLDNNLFLSNIPFHNFSNLVADFDDGNGFVPLSTGTNLSVIYSSTGEKKIQVKATYAGKEYYSASKITILANNNNTRSGCSTTPQPPDVVNNITTTKLGTFVSGSYGVWYSTCNPNIPHVIRKPYIISAGFNPGNGKQLVSNGQPQALNFVLNNVTITLPYGGWAGDWRGLYYETYNGGYNLRFSPTEASQCDEGASNGNMYLDRLRDEGYDVIILMYDNGTDYSINNAALVMELIEKINIEKFNNKYYFENVVSGYSAGGIATKLALSLMESRYKAGQGPNPHTKMWVSIETENQGANFPLGLQHFLDYQKNPLHLMPFLSPLNVYADYINLIAADLASSYNNSHTANEITRFMSSANDGMHSDRVNLLNTFATIPGNNSNGFPEFCRRIGVAQGSGTGVQIPHNQPSILDTKLKFTAAPTNNTSMGDPDCSTDYTWYFPSSEKNTTANWWGSNNNNNIFDAISIIDYRATFFPMVCVKEYLLFGSCVCTGPYTAGSYIVIGEEHVPKPTSAVNYDDVPSSNQSGHIELYEKSTYRFYNNWFAGQSHAYYDTHLHAFAPTVSTLDLHDPINFLPLNNFISPVSLGLMYINKIGSVSTQHPDLRYGFPYIQYPATHYKITPYDAVYAIGNNNGTYSDGITPKPANQFHVEDPQVFIGDYLARVEVAPEDLFLSDRNLGITPSGTIQNNYIAEFEARNNIIVGNGIYSQLGNINYLTPDGDFNIDGNSKAIIHAGNEIVFMPGTNVEQGAELDAYILGYNCPNNLHHPIHTTNNQSDDNSQSSSLDNASLSKNIIEGKKETNGVKIFPNPNNGLIVVENNNEEPNSLLQISDLTGKTVFFKTITNKEPNELNIQHLESGVYLLQVINKNGSAHSKIIITK